MEELAIFKGSKIRRTMNEGQWWFSVVDVVGVLTESKNPRKYWSVLKTRLKEEGSEVTTICSHLKLTAADGKKRPTDCANTEGILRIIQSIPSPKAEPFKRWLAKLGYERIQEINDPELAQQRMRALYKAKGYSDSWIDKRMRGIEVRENLTQEWKDRGVKEGLEYSILTSEISKATFGMTPKEYKDYKSLKHENLRDNMTDLELIFSMLGEASSTEIAQSKNSQGFQENKTAAKEGGGISGDALKNLELKTGKKVSTEKNYLLGGEKKDLLD